jgi:hypothetical protein
VRFALVATIVAFASPALADGSRPVDKGTLGVGIVLGEPTGISAKLYLKNDQAIQAGIGFQFINTGLQLDVDYVFHPWILQDKDSFVLPVYLGPGLRLVDYEATGGSYFAPGLRAIIGLLFDFKTVPLDAFVEVGGIVEFRFGSGGSNHGFAVAPAVGAGVRYYF